MDLVVPARISAGGGPSACAARRRVVRRDGVRGDGAHRLLRAPGRRGRRERDQHDPGIHRRRASTRSSSRPPGVPYAELLDRLIALALERHERRSRLRLLETPSSNRSVCARCHSSPSAANSSSARARMSSSRRAAPSARRANGSTEVPAWASCGASASIRVAATQRDESVQPRREDARPPDERALDRELDELLERRAVAALERDTEPAPLRYALVSLAGDTQPVPLQLARTTLVAEAEMREARAGGGRADCARTASRGSRRSPRARDPSARRARPSPRARPRARARARRSARDGAATAAARGRRAAPPARLRLVEATDRGDGRRPRLVRLAQMIRVVDAREQREPLVTTAPRPPRSVAGRTPLAPSPRARTSGARRCRARPRASPPRRARPPTRRAARCSPAR